VPGHLVSDRFHLSGFRVYHALAHSGCCADRIIYFVKSDSSMLRSRFGSLALIKMYLGSGQRDGALAYFLERRFKAAKLFRAEFREHSLHLPGMFSKS
jgi:hypothetical protein